MLFYLSYFLKAIPNKRVRIKVNVSKNGGCKNDVKLLKKLFHFLSVSIVFFINFSNSLKFSKKLSSGVQTENALSTTMATLTDCY